MNVDEVAGNSYLGIIWYDLKINMQPPYEHHYDEGTRCQCTHTQKKFSFGKLQVGAEKWFPNLRTIKTALKLVHVSLWRIANPEGFVGLPFLKKQNSVLAYVVKPTQHTLMVL